MKKLILCASLSMFGFVMQSYGQQNPVVEKAIKDPNRKSNEGKADVFAADSTKRVLHQQPANMNADSCTVKKRTSKKKCCAVKKK